LEEWHQLLKVNTAVWSLDGEGMPEHVWVNTMSVLAFLVLAFASCRLVKGLLSALWLWAFYIDGHRSSSFEEKYDLTPLCG